VAEWVESGGSVIYDAISQTPHDVRSGLISAGVNVSKLEQKTVWGEIDKAQDTEALRVHDLWIEVYDWHSAIFGEAPEDRAVYVGGYEKKPIDLSRLLLSEEIIWRDFLRIGDNYAFLTERIPENELVDFIIGKQIPNLHNTRSTTIAGVLKNQITDQQLKRLEDGVYGVVDFTADKADRAIAIKKMSNARDYSPHGLRKVNNRVVLDRDQ
jgi:hypothetical protein